MTEKGQNEFIYPEDSKILEYIKTLPAEHPLGGFYNNIVQEDKEMKRDLDKLISEKKSVADLRNKIAALITRRSMLSHLLKAYLEPPEGVTAPDALDFAATGLKVYMEHEPLTDDLQQRQVFFDFVDQAVLAIKDS